MQPVVQVSKSITTSTPTQMTPVNTQLLQKQLEQPLKMDNVNVGLQQQQQHNQPQIQQFQLVQQKPTTLQNVSCTQQVLEWFPLCLFSFWIGIINALF